MAGCSRARWPRRARSTPFLLDAKQPTITPASAIRGGADVRVEDLTWTPARRRRSVLAGLNLHVEAGQRVLVTGPSGAGKSTLLRALAGLLLTSSHGELSGTVLVDGRPPGDLPGDVGLLLQDPAAGVVAETVGRDVAFGLENRRTPRDEIWPLVEHALRAAAFPYDVGHPTQALSGGESQRLALAGSLALRSRVMLLDEPTSMLDPDGASAVRSAVMADVERREATAVIVEHHLEPWLPFVDRLVVLGHGGVIVADGSPEMVLATQGSTLAAQGVWVPGLPVPALDRLATDCVAPWAQGPAELVTAEEATVRLALRLTGRHRPHVLALHRVTASLRSGKVLAVTGRSGAGKSTLVSLLAGLVKPTAGRVRTADALATRKGREPWRWGSRDLSARLSWVPQTSEIGVVSTTVRGEVLATGRTVGRDARSLQRRADSLLEALGLAHVASANPYHLSGGEQRRLMVAAALAHGPYGVLVDEPTVGQDRGTWAAVMSTVVGASAAGTGVAIATHDRHAVTAAADDEVALPSRRSQ